MTDAGETRRQLDNVLADLSTAVGVLGSLEGLVENMKTELTILSVGVGPHTVERGTVAAQALSRTLLELSQIRNRFGRLRIGIEEWQSVL